MPGGIEITLDAEKMKGLMNLEPVVALHDCRDIVTKHTDEAEEEGEEAIDDLLLGQGD